jgi:hypothetical protein
MMSEAKRRKEKEKTKTKNSMKYKHGSLPSTSLAPMLCPCLDLDFLPALNTPKK